MTSQRIVSSQVTNEGKRNKMLWALGQGRKYRVKQNVHKMIQIFKGLQKVEN